MVRHVSAANPETANNTNNLIKTQVSSVKMGFFTFTNIPISKDPVLSENQPETGGLKALKIMNMRQIMSKPLFA